MSDQMSLWDPDPDKVPDWFRDEKPQLESRVDAMREEWPDSICDELIVGFHQWVWSCAAITNTIAAYWDEKHQIRESLVGWIRGTVRNQQDRQRMYGEHGVRLANLERHNDRLRKQVEELTVALNGAIAQQSAMHIRVIHAAHGTDALESVLDAIGAVRGSA